MPGLTGRLLSIPQQPIMQDRIFAFIDGAYLRAGAERYCSHKWIHPDRIARNVLSVAYSPTTPLLRVSYYDARSEDPADPPVADLENHWERVEAIPDTELRFGFLRSRKVREPRQQKGVDVLLAVDLLVGAFSGLFDIAILIAGDADFVPAIQEARRRGVRVFVGGFSHNLHEEMIREADRHVTIDTMVGNHKM